jgi:hypothetical protein
MFPHRSGMTLTKIGRCCRNSHLRCAPGTIRPGLIRALSAPTKIFFTNFIDAIFTTLLERLFTNVFEVIGATQANDCVCRARHAD